MVRDRSSEGHSPILGALYALIAPEHAAYPRRRKETLPKFFVPDLLGERKERLVDCASFLPLIGNLVCSPELYVQMLEVQDRRLDQLPFHQLGV
jgi:hypothetical protein